MTWRMLFTRPLLRVDHNAFSIGVGRSLLRAAAAASQAVGGRFRMGRLGSHGMERYDPAHDPSPHATGLSPRVSQVRRDGVAPLRSTIGGGGGGGGKEKGTVGFTEDWGFKS